MPGLPGVSLPQGGYETIVLLMRVLPVALTDGQFYDDSDHCGSYQLVHTYFHLSTYTCTTALITSGNMGGMRILDV